jgi:hypothetical protein
MRKTRYPSESASTLRDIFVGTSTEYRVLCQCGASEVCDMQRRSGQHTNMEVFVGTCVADKQLDSDEDDD